MRMSESRGPVPSAAYAVSHRTGRLLDRVPAPLVARLDTDALQPRGRQLPSEPKRRIRHASFDGVGHMRISSHPLYSRTAGIPILDQSPVYEHGHDHFQVCIDRIERLSGFLTHTRVGFGVAASDGAFRGSGLALCRTRHARLWRLRGANANQRGNSGWVVMMNFQSASAARRCGAAVH